MYVLIEMADVELIEVRLFNDLKEADKLFDSWCGENRVVEAAQDELVNEIKGTCRMAGDVAHSLQLLKR